MSDSYTLYPLDSIHAIHMYCNGSAVKMLLRTHLDQHFFVLEVVKKYTKSMRKSSFGAKRLSH